MAARPTAAGLSQPHPAAGLSQPHPGDVPADFTAMSGLRFLMLAKPNNPAWGHPTIATAPSEAGCGRPPDPWQGSCS